MMVDDSSDGADTADSLSSERQIDGMVSSAVEALGGKSAQVQFMITKNMRARLSELGYADAEIDNFSPSRAATIIEKQQPSSRRPQEKAKSKSDRFDIQFICNVCDGPNSHSISRHAYRKGTVIVTCPGCNSTHLIADNLNWIEDDFKNIEQAMAKRGVSVDRILKGGVAATAASAAFASLEEQDDDLDESEDTRNDLPPTVANRLDGVTEDEAMRIREAMRLHRRRQA